MQELKKIKNILFQNKKFLKEKYKLLEIAIFGSYARGEQKESSDIDILVEFSETPTLLDIVDLRDYLTELLETKVDLVMKKNIRTSFANQIISEMVAI